MTLYDAIFSRRQVRKFRNESLDKDVLGDILLFVSQAEHLKGQNTSFELVSGGEVRGGPGAPYYLLAFSREDAAAYADVGFVLGEADLYMQSLGLGSGWFMNVKPADEREDFCIALAFGTTDIPPRNGEMDFKRLPLSKTSKEDNAVSRAMRLAPSSLNSQPWQMEFLPRAMTVKDRGRGVKRLILEKKLNKIDIGIAARYAVIALEHEGWRVTSVTPRFSGGAFEVGIVYQA